MPVKGLSSLSGAVETRVRSASAAFVLCTGCCCEVCPTFWPVFLSGEGGVASCDCFDCPVCSLVCEPGRNVFCKLYCA